MLVGESRCATLALHHAMEGVYIFTLWSCPLQMIPPELQSDFAPAGGGGGGSERLGFLPGTSPMPAINLPPTLPDLEHFAASSAMTRRAPLRFIIPLVMTPHCWGVQGLSSTGLWLCPPPWPPSECCTQCAQRQGRFRRAW